jgi:hypothetical protein
MAKALQVGEYFPVDIKQSGGIEGAIAFFKLLNLAGFSPKFIIYYWHIIINVLVGIALFLFVKEISDKKAAIISLILFTLSLTQYEAYWYFLYRNSLALFFMFLALWLIEKKSPLAFWPTLFLTIIHKSTPFIFLLVIVIYLIFKKEWRLLIFELLAILIGGLYVLNFKATKVFFNLLFNKFTNDTHMIKTGSFMEIGEYLKISWLYLIFAFWQTYKNLKSKKFTLPLILFLVTGFLIAIRFIFYKRLIIYFDLGAIILAAIALKNIIQKHLPEFQNQILIIGLIFFSFSNIYYIIDKPLLIPKEELKIIKSIQNYTSNNDYILNIDSTYAPWLEGWSNRKVISPGLLRDTWSFEEWQIFWANNDLEAQKKLLNRYSDPIYLFLGEKNPSFTPNPDCFTSLNKNLYEYTCQ